MPGTMLGTEITEVINSLSLALRDSLSKKELNKQFDKVYHNAMTTL